jgi:CRP/FNR family cyclic AMP-dependent transcriptional regulator
MPRPTAALRSRARSRNAKLELLREVPLFRACTRGDLTRIASLVDEIDVPAGKVLTRQGEPGRECFIIADGKAQASMRGRRTVSMGPGAFFGEISLLDQGPRSASVKAETDMHLLVLTSRDFRSLINEMPAVAYRIMQGLAERLRAADGPRPGH